MIMSDPATQDLIEKNPDMATILTDPEMLQRVSGVFSYLLDEER